jgi:rRNA-processing protein FCF1
MHNYIVDSFLLFTVSYQSMINAKLEVIKQDKQIKEELREPDVKVMTYNKNKK